MVKSAAVSSYEEREHGQSWRNAFGRPVAFRSLGLAILLIAVHALAMLFSLRPHRELLARVSHAAEEEKPSPLAVRIGALVSEIFTAASVQALDAAPEPSRVISPIPDRKVSRGLHHPFSMRDQIQ